MSAAYSTVWPCCAVYSVADKAVFHSAILHVEFVVSNSVAVVDMIFLGMVVTPMVTGHLLDS